MENLLPQDAYISVCSRVVGAHLARRGEIRMLPLSAPFGPVGAVFRERDQHPQLRAFLESLRLQAGAVRGGEPAG